MSEWQPLQTGPRTMENPPVIPLCKRGKQQEVHPFVKGDRGDLDGRDGTDRIDQRAGGIDVFIHL